MLRREIGIFPTIIMDLPLECDLLPQVRKAEKKFTHLAEKFLALHGYRIAHGFWMALLGY